MRRCMYTHIYMHVYVHTCIFILAYICMCVHVYIYIYLMVVRVNFHNGALSRPTGTRTMQGTEEHACVDDISQMILYTKTLGILVV